MEIRFHQTTFFEEARIRIEHYRVFYKVAVGADEQFDITLLDIDDNQQSNLDRFPWHRIIDFDTDE